MHALRFSLSGPPRAPLLLLLHGFMGSRRDWERVTGILSPTSRCLALDLPGHGETGDPGDDALWGMEGCAAAVLRSLDTLGAATVGVLGYSLGGRLALHLAVRHPDRIAKAVIVSASPGLADAADRVARREADEAHARRLEEEGLEGFLEAWYRQSLFAPLREHPAFAEVRRRRLANDPALLARSLRTLGLGNQRSLWEDLPRLATPLLFLVGERDPKFTAIARDAAARSPAAVIRTVPGRGHALVEEDPAAVASEAARFLTDDGPGAPRAAQEGPDAGRASPEV